MQFLINIGGIPSGPPLVFIFSLLTARCTKVELNIMLLRLLTDLSELEDGMMQLSCVKLPVNACYSSSPLVNGSLVIVPLLVLSAPTEDLKLNLLLA